MATTDKDGLATKLGHWTALYAAYLFLAGWAYLRSYFGVFGIDTGWLDLGLNDTVAHGFTVLFGTGAALSFVYLTILLLSFGIEVFFVKRGRGVDLGVVFCLVAIFPVTFWLARAAGINQARIDRGDKTSLPTIDFVAGACTYKGKLVYVKGEAFYVHEMTYLVQPKGPESCPFNLDGVSPTVPQLWLVRSGDLKDVRVIHYAKETK
jgi:hypothetical protein